MDIRRRSLSEVAWVALKLGLTAFGGPAAHIAMLREEVVVRRRWLSEQYFLDIMGATNLIPGPELHGNGDSLRVPARWLAGVDRRREPVHHAGCADGVGAGLGVRALGLDA